MTSFQTPCTECGVLLTRFKSFSKKPFKCFDCKQNKKRTYAKKYLLIHKIRHNPTIAKV